jgi:hypothetical protein
MALFFKENGLFEEIALFDEIALFEKKPCLKKALAATPAPQRLHHLTG